MPINALNSCLKSELNWVENCSVLGKVRAGKIQIFGPVRLKGRGTESRAAALMPINWTESILKRSGPRH